MKKLLTLGLILLQVIPALAADIRTDSVYLKGSSSGYTRLKAPAAAGSTTLTMPTSGGIAGQVLKSDGSGNLDWTSSAGGINYITNGDAEGNATTGWAAYADAAGTSPVNGTGGSPTTTWTASGTSPLRGSYSFLLTKDAANRQGEGASYDFTIDAADKYSMQTVSFDYTIASGTYADGDVTIWIYDVTNATLIQPAPTSILNTGVATKYVTEFQTSGSTSYRLILHVSTTSASAYTLKFDNFKCGPTSKTLGSAIIDSESFTPTGSWSNTTYTGKKSRVGDKAHYDIELAINGAVSGVLTVNLPNTIDTTKLNSTANPPLGIWWGKAAGNAIPGGVVRYNSATSVDLIYGSGSAPQVAGQVTNTGPASFTTGDYIKIKLFDVPIVGWSSSTVMSSDADTRVVAGKYTRTGAYSVTSSPTAIAFDTKLEDTHGAYSGSTLTIPVPGVYEFFAHGGAVSNTWSVNSSINLALFINGVQHSGTTRQITTATYSGISTDLFDTATLKAGDTVQIKIAGNSSNSMAGSGLDPDSFSWKKLSGPAQIAASETVSVILSGTTTSCSADTVVTPTTILKDSHGAFSGNTFTVPVSGEYLMTMSTQGNNETWVASGWIESYVKINGVGTVVGGQRISANTSYPYASGSLKRRLLAGQTIQFKVSTSTTTTPTLFEASITRVGNY